MHRAKQSKIVPVILAIAMWNDSRQGISIVGWFWYRYITNYVGLQRSPHVADIEQLILIEYVTESMSM